MRTQTTAVVLLVCCVAGCAASPPPAATASRSTTEARIASESKTTAAASAGESGQAVEVKQRVPAGYRAETVNGVFVYCKSTATLGSRFKKDVCLTPEAYKELEATAERNRQDMKQAIGICGGNGPGSCSGG